MNEEKSGISFINIPIQILQNKELTANEKILFSYLSIFEKKFCFQSNEVISEALGMSVPTISRGLKKLEELKFIYIRYNQNNKSKREIYIVFHKPGKLHFLINRDKLESFPHSNQNDKTETRPNQNDKESNQNDYTHNRGEPNQNDYYKIYIKYNKRKDESSDSDFEGLNQAFIKGRLSNSEKLINAEKFEEDFYNRNTITIATLRNMYSK